MFPNCSLPENYRWMLLQFEVGEGDPDFLLHMAGDLINCGNLEGAATILDRAYGLAPKSEPIVSLRKQVLTQLAVVEHGMVFRYIPGGVFLMGNDAGERDERPWHPVWLSPYWMAEMPISWRKFCELMRWDPPPMGVPSQQPPDLEGDRNVWYRIHAANRIRHHYCVGPDFTGRQWTVENRETAFQTDLIPMVAVSWHQAMELGNQLSTSEVCYTLPSEAQWEKAARGGLIGSCFSWGKEPPTKESCDFGRFHHFSIKPMDSFPTNGYGLKVMNGTIWEWTRDWYDRDYYRAPEEINPPGPHQGEEKILRGGSWADCAEAVTNSFRMSLKVPSTAEGRDFQYFTPTIGFRLCRMAMATSREQIS